jgi:glycosyltransferase involved in cell wall biosynthesis
MRIVHITAGAGGRICGSCLHDNTLVRALKARGRDALLVPAYVPTTSDEENVAEAKIVMGGLNVWLQETIPLFRHTPALLDRLFEGRWLLRQLSRLTGSTRASDLGPLTVSSLAGERGHQRKEVAKLARWLADDIRPDIVHLSNALLIGLARSIRAATGAGIICSLSGEDLFVDQIPQPDQGRVWQLLAERAEDVDRFVAMGDRYADIMATRLRVCRNRVVVIPHGVDPAGFPPEPPDLAARRAARSGRLVIGFLARACPEKGLDQAVRALPLLTGRHDVELVAAGAEIVAERAYREGCQALAEELGVADRFRWLGQIDRATKLSLLASIDLFVMPTTHPEAKGLPVIEAMAAGVPVVAPAEGSFPELIGPGSAAAGLLHEPRSSQALAEAVARLLEDLPLAEACGRVGHARVRQRHLADQMAAAHERLYQEVLAVS